MYKLEITAKAKRQLKQIEKLYEQQAVDSALLEIKENPFFGKPLMQELTGKFSLRVGVYRIIYTIDEDDQVVTILSAGHRATVYQ